MTDEARGACCDNPQPRILDTNGRLFCGSCKRYLDRREPTQPPLPETPRMTKVVKD